jgi:hypothetical protein
VCLETAFDSRRAPSDSSPGISGEDAKKGFEQLLKALFVWRRVSDRSAGTAAPKGIDRARSIQDEWV